MAQYEKQQHLSSSFRLHARGEEIYNNEISTKFTARAREILSSGEIKQCEFKGDAYVRGTITLTQLLYRCYVKDKVIYLFLYYLRNI